MIDKNFLKSNQHKNPSNTVYPPFVKYPRIPYLKESQEIFGYGGCFNGYVFEKLDGGLCQVRNTISGIVGGSKANYLTGNRTKASWTWFPDFLR